MKLVVGLGNPGTRYVGTRHNVGFRILGELARRHGAPRPKIQFEAEVSEIVLKSQRVLLLAPQTFMNASGRSVGLCVRFFRIPLDDLIVICDDMNLALGQLRFRAAGSSGGQKGLQDVVQHLGEETFPRLRIGIGRPGGRVTPTDFVLSRFRSDEREIVENVIVRAADGVERWITDGIETAMNQFNSFPTKQPISGHFAVEDGQTE